MKMKIIAVFAFVIGSFTAFAIQCTMCGQTMLESDTYCTNCGRERYEAPPAVQKPRVPAYVPQPSPPPAFQEQRRQTNYDNRSESESSDGVGERLLGMGRGVVTVTLSPLNVFRGVTTSFNCFFSDSSKDGSVSEKGSFDAGQLGPLGAVLAGGVISICTVVGVTLGSFTTCVDACNGVFDIGTVGYYGDWLYDSKERGKPTPWIWDRGWITKKVPWIDRK